MKTSSALNCQLRCYCKNTLPTSAWLSTNSFFNDKPLYEEKLRNKKLIYCRNDHGFATIQIWTKVTRSAFWCAELKGEWRRGFEIILHSEISQQTEGCAKKCFHVTCCVEGSSVVGAATTIRAGRNGVRIPIRVNNFPFLQNVQTSSEAQQSSYSVGTEVLSQG
jgi:hypothetical protein